MSSASGKGSGGLLSRGRHSRGGLGKYLRARGRRGYGRPAEFRERLVLEGEQEVELDEEEKEEMRNKYSRRALESNSSRYEEERNDEENKNEEEEEEEPEVDLSSFLARQRLDDQAAPPLFTSSNPNNDKEDDDIDHSLRLRSPKQLGGSNKKGQVHQIEWDRDMDELKKEKESAEAVRDLKARFKGERASTSRYAKGVFLADPELERNRPPEGSKEEMEEFLDELLK